MKEAVIISGARTPVGRYIGALKEIPAYDLAALVLEESVKRANITPDIVEEVLLGQSYQNGETANVARVALLKAGWPEHVTGMTIDRRCCTGLNTVCLAGMMIQSEQAEVVVAGGVESMSNGEFYIPGDVKWGIGGKNGMPRGHGNLAMWGIPMYDRIQRARVMSQPEERYGILPSMMSWAETAAREENISREECDEWAYNSHMRAIAAMEAGKFDQEIVPVSVPQRKGAPIIVDKDENPRADTTIKKLAKLRPVMGGVCTAGNSSTENDAAAAVVVTSTEKAAEIGIEPMGSIKTFAVGGTDPRKAYLSVPVAVEKALKKANMTIDQIELIEIQEAFAAQVLADIKHMGLGRDAYDIINVNGSGISLGHPIGATGTRVLVTLLNEMKRRNLRYGLEVICGGGGLGICAIVERNI
ncbi:MAG: acetyl-CoA C-acyltransferase [Deltaproteobacteria bacterium]|nr:acetyl-CoA C-acyltransferase [Deltaproteobacteria bacterium]